MTTYRGIERDALIDSLARAEQFLRGCNLGPATVRLLDSWLSVGKPFENLPKAKDETALAWAMNSTHTSTILQRFHDVFAHHAMVAFQKGETGSPAQNLYRDLSAWNAFDGKRTDGEIPGEVTDHIILESLALLKERGVQQVLPESGKQLRSLAGGYDDTAEWLEDTVPVLELMFDTASREEASALLNGNDMTDKGILKGILYRKTGLSRAADALDVPHAIRRFAIVPAIAQNVPSNMEHKLFEFLEPYTGTSEVDLASVRLLSDGFENTGVAFRATARVAREVAEAFGQYANFRLVDGEGQAYIASPQP